MGSLIWKDIVVAKWLLVAAVPVYVVQLMALASVPPAFVLLTVLGMTFFSVVSLAVDETQRTEVLWNSLPVSRDQIVYARYLTVALGLVFALGLAWLVGGTLPGQFADESGAAHPLGIGGYAALGCVVLVLLSLFLPCYFRFGVGTGIQVFSGLSVGLLILLSVAGSLVVLASGGSAALAELRTPTPEQVEALAQWLEMWARVLLGVLAAVTLSVQFYRSRDL